MKDLQKLTSQKLVFKAGSKGQGRIEFAGTPSGGKKTVGTNLVNKLIESPHQIIIKNSSDGDNYTSYTNQAAANGKTKGGSGATVEYNPNNNADGQNGVVNADGTTGRPPQVGLSHELGHAEKGIDGEATSTNAWDAKERAADLKNGTLFIVKDPDNNNSRQYMNRDEIDVRTNVDNPIREEQGAKKRALPVVTD